MPSGRIITFNLNSEIEDSSSLLHAFMLRSIWNASFPTHLTLFGRTCSVALFFSLALCGTASAASQGNQGSGIPVGSFGITTVEGTALQSASGYNYSVVGFATFPNGGSFDPQGTITLERSWQGIDANGNYTAPTPPVNGGIYKPANSGFDKHNGAKLGSFTAGYPGDCTTTLEVNG